MCRTERRSLKLQAWHGRSPCNKLVRRVSALLGIEILSAKVKEVGGNKKDNPRQHSYSCCPPP